MPLWTFYSRTYWIPGQRETDRRGQLQEKLIFLTGYHMEVHKAPVWNLDKWVYQKSDSWPGWRKTTRKLRDNWRSVGKPSRSAWCTRLYRCSIQSVSESTCSWPAPVRHRNFVSLCAERWQHVWKMRRRKIQFICCMTTHMRRPHQCKHTKKNLLKLICKAALSEFETHQLFGFRTYWFGVINRGPSSKPSLCFSFIKQRLFFNNLLKYNKDKLLLFPSELGGFINPTVSSKNISQSRMSIQWCKVPNLPSDT